MQHSTWKQCWHDLGSPTVRVAIVYPSFHSMGVFDGCRWFFLSKPRGKNQQDVRTPFGPKTTQMNSLTLFKSKQVTKDRSEVSKDQDETWTYRLAATHIPGTYRAQGRHSLGLCRVCQTIGSTNLPALIIQVVVCDVLLGLREVLLWVISDFERISSLGDKLTSNPLISLWNLSLLFEQLSVFKRFQIIIRIIVGQKKWHLSFWFN